MADTPTPGANENVWQQIRAFVQQHPSVGVIFLIIPLIPVLANVLDKDDPIGPILWSLIIIVALPPLFNVARALIDGFVSDTVVRRFLVYCFGFCCGVLMLAGTAFLVLLLFDGPFGNDLRAQETAPITDEERQAAPARENAPETTPALEDDDASRFLVFSQETETQVVPVVSFEPDFNDTPQDIAPAPENADAGFNACIRAQHARGNAEGVIDCVVLLED